jgi:hypothetical protein
MRRDDVLRETMSTLQRQPFSHSNSFDVDLRSCGYAGQQISDDLSSKKYFFFVLDKTLLSGMNLPLLPVREPPLLEQRVAEMLM